MAVILPNLLNPFFSMVAHYINRALVNRGYRMLLCDTEYDYTKEQEMVQMVAQNKVDGIIALTYNPDLKIPPDVRSVSIDRYLSGSTTCVASDNYNGGRLGGPEAGGKRLQKSGIPAHRLPADQRDQQTTGTGFVGRV